MGVPKFFRYISERYPCLSELVKETQIPEFDNLYLDMNGIIHNCSHPDDDNVHFRITEEQIFTDIFHYIDTLFRMIQPRKLFFMAVDGVAPRAKMNQQRGRRFRSAKEAETKENQARQKGETLPDTVRFDSNCITPGTAFMVRLQDGLKQFVQNKISTNPLWRQCRVILSGHETPGEGEHKIMEYIRYLKATPAFNPNTRHCLYGLDADLVMLGLCSHELHFSLLREEVKFGNKAKRNTSVDTTRFFLLHLGLMREYLELEFIDVKARLPFAYDMDAIVDDWILMCYLVGNDFIPNLPNFHINTNALPTFYAAYKKVLPTLGGYINEAGVLNLRRLEIFLAELGEVDRELFKQKNGNLECLRVDNEETFGDFAMDGIGGAGDGDEANNGIQGNDELRELAQNTLDMYLGDLDEEDDAAIAEREFVLHKRDYYIKKMGYAEMTPEVLAEQAECYVRALQWTLFYYYRGVKSWCWYYPHHYAPYISDVRNFSHLKLSYEEGKPFLPFQQLLAVLPAASRAHLPNAYHGLMTSPQSRVIDYYPADFETDLNGKKQDWEAVVLIPFIEERRLLEAMDECQHMLTADEMLRNTHGPMYQYDYCERDQGARPEAAAFGLTDFRHTFCTEIGVYRRELQVADDKLVLGTSPGVLRDVYFAGFPTFKHLPYTGKTNLIRARVFDMPSNNPSMVVKLDRKAANADANEYAIDADAADDNDEQTGTAVGLAKLQALADKLIGTIVYVGWPHLAEAKVVSVCDREYECVASDEQQKYDSRRFEQQAKSIASHYLTRMGIDIGCTRVLVCAQPLREQKYQFGERGRMSLTKLWSDLHVHYALQTVVRNVRMHTAVAAEHTHVRDVYPLGSVVFMASHNLYYGARGTVIDVESVTRTGRIGVQLEAMQQPDFRAAHAIEQQTMTRYMNTAQICAALAMHHTIVSQITGTYFVTLGAPRFPLPDNTPRVNIGLQLKFPKRHEELVGYTKRIGQTYTYSQQAVDLVAAFAKRWPQVFASIRNRNQNDAVFETAIFGEKNSREKLNELQAWLKEQPHLKAERRACGAKALEMETVREVVKAVERMNENGGAADNSSAAQSLRLKVLPHSLYKPGLGDEKCEPDASAVYELFDRVVVVKATHTVPLGKRGTVVAIHSLVDPNPVRQENVHRAELYYDVLFDEQFDDGGTIYGVCERRMFKISPLHLLNITYGSAKFQQGNGQKNASVAPSSSMSTSARKGGDNNSSTSAQSSADIWAMLKKAKEQGVVDVPADLGVALARNDDQQRQRQKKPHATGNSAQTVAPAKSEPTKPQRQPQQQPKHHQALQNIQQRPNEEQLAFGQLMEQMKKSAAIAPPMQPAVVAAPVEQYQQIQLADMFRVDAKTLPKPPMTWRTQQPVEPETNDSTPIVQPAQKQPQMIEMPSYRSYAPPFGLPPPPFSRPLFPAPQQQQQQHQHIHPPQPPQHFTRPNPHHPQLHPLQQQQLRSTLNPHQNYVPFTMHQPPPFYPQPHGHQPQMQQQQQQHQQQPLQNHQYHNRQGPQGPQNLRQNGVYPSAQGAFIPLQATRKQAASQAAAAAAAAAASGVASNKDVSNKKTNFQILRRNEAANRNSKTEATDSPSTASSSKPSDGGVEKHTDKSEPKAATSGAMPARFIVPPAPKPSRIAARFDMTQKRRNN